ncbi:MAG: hypothetical protein ACNA7E_02370 [Wenzhouxiangellaceae bacterium]
MIRPHRQDREAQQQGAVDLMARDLSGPRPAGLAPLVDSLRERYGDSLRALVLYGSTRRSDDPRDGLVDLLAIVTGYRAAHGIGLAAVFNRLLPPNVYYLEAGTGENRLRCKYIIISEAGFRRRMRSGLDAYFWARFTQPCRLLWSADADSARSVAQARAMAAECFATNAAGLADGELTASQFWELAVRASYNCELRPEPPGAARTLIERDPEFWATLSAEILPRLPGVQAATGGYLFAPATGAGRRARLRWRLRRYWSRTLNILRLFKAAGTFANGVDYLGWKLERHSGIRIEITERMRKYPRLAAWGLLFKLIRSGALR